MNFVTNSVLILSLFLIQATILKTLPKVKRKLRCTKKPNKETGTPIKGKTHVKGKGIANSKHVIYWECGKRGHTLSQCKVRKKINELNISEEENKVYMHY